MPRLFITVCCVFALLSVSACRTSVADAPKPTLKTDDEVRAAYKAATGKELEKDWGCIGRPESFPHVVLIGAFAHDRGCVRIGLFVDSTWTPSWDDALPEVLALAGWKDADGEGRQKLAKAWLEEAVFLWAGSPVFNTEKAFELESTPTFTPPKYVTLDDGGVEATVWFQEPSGMLDEREFSKARFRFAADGRLTRTSEGGFAVPGPLLRGEPE